MKKLMIMLSLAAMAMGARADAQFYEMDLTVKTTVTKSGKVKMVACDCRTDTNTLYRKQGNVKIKGVIWGCDCGTLIKGEPYTSSTNAYGYFFWNVTTKKPLNVKLDWLVNNRIDSTAKKAEVVWTLTSTDGLFSLTGAGFGTIKDTVTKDPCKMVTSWFPSLNGSFAGWMLPGAIVTTAATDDGCSWCGKVKGTEEVSAAAPGWGICSDCAACTDMTGSAAYGTWKIKYNARVSKKLDDKKLNITKITEAYSFPDYVKAVMD